MGHVRPSSIDLPHGDGKDAALTRVGRFDSDMVIPGSNPGIPTTRRKSIIIGIDMLFDVGGFRMANIPTGSGST